MRDLEMTFDIDLLKAACEVIDVQFLSVNGIQSSISMTHLASNGTQISADRPRTYEEIRDHMKQGGGCKVKGTIHKHFLSEPFYIVYSMKPVLMQIFNELPELRLDLSHRIHTLNLGDSSQHSHLAE